MTAGFGLEFLGLWALRYARAVSALVVVVTAALLFGASHLQFESDIREIFRSDSPDYAVLEEAARQYPASERDVLVVLQGENLLRRDTIEDLRTLHLELVLLDGVTEVLSIFSARAPPDETGEPPPLIPAVLPETYDPEILKAQLLGHPLIADKLLADDATLVLLVVSLDGALNDIEQLSAMFQEIKRLRGEVLDSARISMALTGMPVMRIEIIDALRRDQLTFKVVGFAFGAFLTWLFFQRLRYVLIVGAPVLVAIVWQLGAMWLFSQKLNVLTAVVPTLVMVVAFSDALHLLFAVRHNVSAGSAVKAAIEKAVRDVGPACVLTSITTTMALISLTLVPHPFIAGFGLNGAMGTVIAYLATITIFPIVALPILTREKNPPKASDNKIAVLCEVLSRRAADLVHRHAAAIAAVSVAILVIAGYAYSQNVPHHVYKENLPKNNDAFRAIAAVDDKLAGTGTLYAFLRWKSDGDIFSTERRAAIAAVHDVFTATPEIGSVWSLQSIADWFSSGAATAGTLPEFLRKYEDLFANRVISPADNSALVTGYLVNVDAASLTLTLNALENRLAPVRSQFAGLDIAVTGIDAVSARASVEMIGQLNRSLALAIIVIIAAIGLALRSARASLVSILPNTLPIAVGGSYLFFSGIGLQFTSVVAFTISFGIAVDSTIHMLNRYRLETAVQADRGAALRRTVLTIGPVLLVSTVVLVFGLGVTMTSVMPTVQLYGRVSVIVLLTALAANMIFLPAILKLTAPRRRAKG